MSTLCHLHSEFDNLRVTSDDDGVIWIRGQHVTVSFDLEADDRAALRAALHATAPARPMTQAEEAAEVHKR